MEGRALLQLFLLGQMRATNLVRAAIRELGASPAELEASGPKAESYGLATLGHPMSLYEDLIGEPPLEEVSSREDEYRRLAHHYHLAVWPDLRFTVWGSAARRTAGVGFTAEPEAPRVARLSVEELKPWHTVEDQLSRALESSRVTDEWYPLKDYECALQGPGGIASRLILRFDFNLLQEVVFLDSSRVRA